MKMRIEYPTEEDEAEDEADSDKDQNRSSTIIFHRAQSPMMINESFLPCD